MRQMTLPTMVPTRESATRTLTLMMTGTAYSLVARLGVFHPAGTAIEVWLVSAAWLLPSPIGRVAAEDEAAAAGELRMVVDTPSKSSIRVGLIAARVVVGLLLEEWEIAIRVGPVRP